MRIRKNVKQLTAAEKSNFCNALVLLKSRPSVLHPAGPNFRYDDFVETHINAMMANPGWGHNRPGFFSWHRILLLQLENELQAIDPTVTIPYWDWLDAASFPLTSDFLGTDGDPTQDFKVIDGPFAVGGPHHWTLIVVDNPGDPNYLRRMYSPEAPPPFGASFPTASQVNGILAITPYEVSPYRYNDGSFRAQLEGGPHNNVHNWISGTMGGMTSPNDPVFWFHHCNIDRLWALWQKMHPSEPPYLPSSGADPGHNLHDTMIFSAPGATAPWSPTYSPADVTEHHLLGYVYDTEIVKLIEKFQFENLGFGKPQLVEKSLIGDKSLEKMPKEKDKDAEGPVSFGGDPWQIIGDLRQRVLRLEAGNLEGGQGRAFIGPEHRPAVGFPSI